MSAGKRHLEESRLHDLADGELDPVEERSARAHLRGCDRCERRAARLAALLQAARALPEEARPSRDLWPGIESRIRGGASVIPFPRPGDAVRPPAQRDAETVGPNGGSGEPRSDDAGLATGSRRFRRVSVPVPLLWAAGLVVSLLSGGAVWLALGGGSARVATGVDGATPPAEVSRVGAPDAVPRSRLQPASAAYEEATSELEAILEAGRELLGEETLRTVRESLASIDRAIAEAEDALARDPGSELLNRLLLQHQRTRLRILRQATNGLSART